MKIDQYLAEFEIDSKCFLLLTITPKGEYPLKSYGQEFDNFVENIFNGREKYIGLFDPKRKEILQDVAFKLFTMPLIGDSYDIRNKKLNKVKRATESNIESFVVLKEFYSTVPHGELTEEDAIEIGKEKAVTFLQEFPLDQFDITITKHSRNEDGVQFSLDMEFNFTKGYYFDKVYSY
ncbi:hypothetical protein V7266_12320 [Neobacillus drentensis]|uniref:hypothetical protein n=1 Tax=Neobacillus drentensis TaxID=220684 RepID=UPI002FFE5626